VHTAEPAEPRPAAADATPWSAEHHVARPADEPRAGSADVIRAVAVTFSLYLALGCAAGWLWSLTAEPALYLVTGNNAVMDEVQAGREFGPDVVYSLIAVIAGVASGTLLGRMYAGLGWVLPVATALAAGMSALVAWRLGVALGPPDPLGLLRDAQAGDTLPARLDVHARGLLLLWPIAALIGLIASIATTPAHPVRHDRLPG